MSDVNRVLPKCPKCGKCYTEKPSLSRTDNKTEICSTCAMREATDAWIEYLYNKQKENYNKNISEK